MLAALYNQVDSDDPVAVAENASLTVNYLSRATSASSARSRTTSSTTPTG